MRQPERRHSPSCWNFSKERTFLALAKVLAGVLRSETNFSTLSAEALSLRKTVEGHAAAAAAGALPLTSITVFPLATNRSAPRKPLKAQVRHLHNDTGRQHSKGARGYCRDKGHGPGSATGPRSSRTALTPGIWWGRAIWNARSSEPLTKALILSSPSRWRP